MNERKYLAYLHHLGLSQNDLRRLCGEEGRDAREIFESLNEESLVDLWIKTEKCFKILESYKKFQSTKIDWVLKDRGVEIVLESDDIYPRCLKEIPHSPYMLYVRGKLPVWEMFAVVGSRKMTSYGKSVIEKIIPDIAKIFTIVSGWALGCDSEAHKTTLASGWNTISVIWTWIDKDYPATHAKLFSEIIQAWWAIISIFPIGEEAFAYNFPIRNEIVVGLSRWVLVVEAKEKSGTLITAWLCLDMGRDLFAVPWDILKSSHTWVNRLIKNGEAKCVLTSEDILEEYDILLKKSVHSAQLPLLTPLEQEIYNQLCLEEMNVDSLCVSLSKSAWELSMSLSLLELKWLIRKQLSWKFRLS